MTKVYPNKAGLQGTTETSHLVRPGTVKVTELISTVTDTPVFTHKSTSTSLFTNTADTFITTKPPSRATSFPKPQLFTTVAELLTRFSNKSITLENMAIKSGKILDEHVNICGTNVWLVISVILLVFVAAQTCYIFRPSQPSTQLFRFLQLFRTKQPPKPEVQRANPVDLIRLEPVSQHELPVKHEDHSTPIRKHIVLRSSDLPPTPVLPITPNSPQFVDIVECCSNGNGFGLENASTLSDDYVDFLGHHPFLLSAITTILFELHKNKAQSQTDFRTRGSAFSQVMADAVSRLQAIYILDKQGLVDMPFGRLASEADIVAFFRRAERNGLVDSGLLLPKKRIKIVDVTTVQISDSVED